MTKRHLDPLRLGALAIVLLASTAANAQEGPRGVVHRVSDAGEGYADIAEHYYGKRYLERHLRLYNRRPEPLDRGATINVPTRWTVSLKRGETLEDIAKRHLLDPKRADYLAELIGSDRPRPGTGIPIVVSVNHVVRPGESLRSIARMYYREASPRRLKLLMLYNKLGSERVKKSVRIPLDGSEFDRQDVERRAKVPFAPRPLVAERPDPPPAAKKRPSGGAAKKPPRNLDDVVDQAERLYDEGEYERCAQLAKAERESGEGPVEPRVELLRVEASALIALGRLPESRARFKELLSLDPKYELDLYRTSPKILDVFEAVAER